LVGVRMLAVRWEANGAVEIIEQHQDEDVRRTGFICGSRWPSEHHVILNKLRFTKTLSFWYCPEFPTFSGSAVAGKWPYRFTE
jgi:hypothetical protein